MQFLSEFALFAIKTLFVVGGCIAVLIAGFYLAGQQGKGRPQLEVEKLNNRFRDFRRFLQAHIMGRKQYKELAKQEKKADKKNDEPRSVRVFVLDFHGDLRATAVSSLREEITAILSVSKPGDEVVLRLESPGGMVTTYGLAASQLARIKERGLHLTVCVDKVAASGGYMMACVANQILAAPFAIVGSVGVVAQVPNVHKLLKRNDIDYREITAGEFKRTVSVFGEITEPGLEKFKSQIEDTHTLFKDFVTANRPQVDIAKVATGEHWYGTQALGLKLVDTLKTSDDYLHDLCDRADVFLVHYHQRKRITERLSESLGHAAHHLLLKIWGDLDRTRFGL